MVSHKGCPNYDFEKVFSEYIVVLFKVSFVYMLYRNERAIFKMDILIINFIKKKEAKN